MPKRSLIKIIAAILVLFLPASFVFSANTVLDAGAFVQKVSVSLNPRTGTFTEGSTFEVPIILNSKGVSVNGIDVKINYDQNKLSIVQPSGGQSIIGVWIEPPSFDNTKGVASYVGVIPNGITTGSGLIGTITFQAKATGKAVISVKSTSRILLNDGAGTEAQVELGRSEYAIISKPPEGVKIFSETHPFSGDWYNNNNPVISWERDAGVTGFSYVIDDKPVTVPENTILTTDTTKSFESLADGLWYFHIKAYKNGVWGNPGHFLIRIDTAPPADFTPQANYVVAAIAFVERALVSFFTTDNLSGIDHYEVGVIDKGQPNTLSPVFVQTESPYQVSASSKAGLRVIVRAVDKAGNVRDSSIDVKAPFAITKFIKDYLTYILLGIIAAGLFGWVFHYLFGHHIIAHFRRAIKIVEEEENKDHPPEL